MSDSPRLAQRLYEAYNAGGDPATANLNYRGEPCPSWEDLPPNVRNKWQAAAEYAGHFFVKILINCAEYEDDENESI
jgi:hypothetical protein